MSYQSFQIHYDDPVFQHGITNSLVKSMTMEVILQAKPVTIFDENLYSFKKAVELLQTAWYGEGGIPPVYEDKHSDVGPQLKEVLSFPTHGKLRMSDDLWQSYLLTQPMWSVISGLAEAYNNVLRARGESGAETAAWSFVHFLLRWFQGFVRSSDVVRAELLKLLTAYYPKADREKEYKKHVALLENFTWNREIAAIFKGASYSEAYSGAYSGANGGLGVVALLGVGAAAFLLFR